MRNVNAFSRRDILRSGACALGASFLSASCTSSQQDAPSYKPEAWNGHASFSALTRLYQEYTELIEKLVEFQNDRYGERSNDSYNRPYFASVEKALTCVRIIGKYADVPYLFRYFGVDKKTAHQAESDFEIFYPHAQKLRKANCYSYMTDDPTGYFKNPGRRTYQKQGHVFTDRTDVKNFQAYADEIITGITYDGCEFVGSEPTLRDGYYLGAVLVKKPISSQPKLSHIMDVHFLRRDDNGFWSHKYGPNIVTDLDYAGHKITDPRRAALAPHEFIGFINVPKGGLKPKSFHTELSLNL